MGLSKYPLGSRVIILGQVLNRTIANEVSFRMRRWPTPARKPSLKDLGQEKLLDIEPCFSHYFPFAAISLNHSPLFSPTVSHLLLCH